MQLNLNNYFLIALLIVGWAVFGSLRIAKLTGLPLDIAFIKLDYSYSCVNISVFLVPVFWVFFFFLPIMKLYICGQSEFANCELFLHALRAEGLKFPLVSISISGNNSHRLSRVLLLLRPGTVVLAKVISFQFTSFLMVFCIPPGVVLAPKPQFDVDSCPEVGGPLSKLNIIRTGDVAQWQSGGGAKWCGCKMVFGGGPSGRLQVATQKGMFCRLLPPAS